MKNSIAVATLCALPFAVGAQTERDLDSHDHGAGSLNVAIENNSVYLELSTPWENLVGFEHAPSTDEQKSLVAAALDTLNDPSQLFSFVGSDCSVQSAEIENTMSAEHSEHEEGHEDEHHDEHEDEHEEHADGHEDEHKDEHEEHAEGHEDEHEDQHEEHAEGHKDEHDEHDDHAEGHDEHESTHSAVLAIYTYECADAGALETLDLAVFNTWQGFEELDVQLLGPAGATGLELTPDNSSIDLTQVVSR